MHIVMGVSLFDRRRKDQLFKTFTWEVVPKIGEFVILDRPSMSLRITFVGHYLELDVVEVHACVNTVEEFEEFRKNGWSEDVQLSLWSRFKNQQLSHRRA